MILRDMIQIIEAYESAELVEDDDGYMIDLASLCLLKGMLLC